MTMEGPTLDPIFAAASKENRQCLMEHETYQLLHEAGLTTIPLFKHIKTGDDVTESILSEFPGDLVVIKIISPSISHKTDVGGVRMIPKDLKTVQKTITDMLDHVPENFVNWLHTTHVAPPQEYRMLTESEMRDACRKDIRGVLIVEFISPSRTGFGYEILFGLRWDREFGPVLTAGLGGIDTELYAKVMTSRAATISMSVMDSTPDALLNHFKQTIAYQKLAGKTRGGKPVIDDAALIRCFDVFRKLGRDYGPEGSSAFCIQELEINPFFISNGGLIPLDGLCSFSRRSAVKPKSPTHKIGKLLRPSSMAIIGVSAQKLNMGRIILRNVIGKGFPCDRLVIIRPEIDQIDGVACVPSITALPEKVDVLVLAVDAAQAPAVIQEAARSRRVESVIIIPGGLGEKSGTEAIVEGMNNAIRESRSDPDGGPVFVGGNCLGILSRPGNYDTLFVPEQKLPKNYEKSPDPVVFLSQSGARMITVMSQQSHLSPQFAISTGNQMDLGVSDFLEYMADHEPEIAVFAVYVEGFKDLGGLKLIRTIKKLRSQERDVIFYKAGRTEAGKSATSGHTASVAGSYTVCSRLLEESGAMVCDNFTDFNELIRLSIAFRNKKVRGNRLAAISNAGYETVGIADNIDGPFGFTLATYAPATEDRIRDILRAGRIDTLVDIRNPMDVTPMGNDDVHEGIIRAQMADPNVDCVMAATVPLTPAQQTLPEGIFGKEDIENDASYPKRLIRIAHESAKPMVVVIDSGKLYDPMVQLMERNGLIVFRTADLAIRIFGKYINNRLLNKVE